ncbi:MAG: hypothetical protein L0271_17435 [Gemmatimonadetes bacterium]|nr:hypothetical protein [Gemmatimonadota bacterium]
MNEEISARRARRLDFLTRIYTRTGSDVRVFVDAFEIGEAMGLGREETTRIVAYFEDHGTLKVDDYTSGMVRLTAAGVDHAESGIATAGRPVARRIG